MSEKSRKANKDAKKSKSFKDWKEPTKNRIWVSLIITFWLLTGLFTYNWVGYLAILMFNVLIVSTLSNINKYGSFYICLHWFNSVIGFCFVLFVILNTYHMHIDLYKILLSWL